MAEFHHQETDMQRSLLAIGLTSMVLLSAPLSAQDSTAHSKKETVAQRMKECMDRQKASNSGMTQAAMETTCRNEAKRDGTKDGNDLASGPKAKTPGNNSEQSPPQ
jgi:hypothetical protein